MSRHPILTGLSRYRGIVGLGAGLVLGSAMVAIASFLPVTAAPAAPASLRGVDTRPEAPIPFGKGETLKVGVKPIIPFIFVEDASMPYGYSVDLWEAIAERMAVETEYVVYETTPDL
ncbi:MAG: transporter substrate-binding domain-containing protein, partial [Cyanobacteria bacterium J06638_6]